MREASKEELLERIKELNEQLDETENQLSLATVANEGFTETHRILVVVLERNLMDMDRVDNVCEIAQVHPFTIMRNDIVAALAAIKGDK